MRAGVLAIGAAAAMVLAAPARAQTLVEALSSAWETNPTLAAERARQRETREQGPQAVAGLLPRIQASGGASELQDDSRLDAAAFGGVGATRRVIDRNPVSGRVELQQSVYDGLRGVNTLRAARARVRAGAARLVDVEQSVLQEAAVAYFDVLRDTMNFESGANQVDVLLKQLRQEEARRKAGESSATDVAQAEARLARARAGLASAQAQLSMSRTAFARIIGEEPSALERSPALPKVPDSVADAIEAAKADAPELLEAREAEKAAVREVAVARGVFQPALTFGAAYSYDKDPSAFTLSNEQKTIGLRANVPLFTGGLNLSRLREAKARADQARARVEEAERQIAADARDAFEQLSAARATIAAARVEADSARVALEGVRREQFFGERTTLDVLNAEQELLNAQTRLAGAERNERAATMALLAAMGALTPATLGLRTEK